ncbi:MAG: hypothetical protein Q8Q37_02035, partial [bacterium]|nr:hypothetical protein [bacterium]
LGQLNDKQKLALFNKLQENLINKDIMIYLKDNDLENYLQIWGLGGEIYSTILDTNVDYLAVVNANVAGGKSDAFIKQDIILRSRIDERGAVTNDLTIKRDHRGADEEDWWYRATNKNYLQVLTSRDASLQSISGGVYKVAPVFSKIGYQADTELKAIEGTAMLLKNGVVEEFYQFGKKTFATWLDVPVGKQKQINLKYQRDNVIKVADGERYQFVFDKQSGVESDLEINIEAPSGYKWRENNSDTFTYKTSSVPGRLILDLTLTK